MAEEDDDQSFKSFAEMVSALIEFWTEVGETGRWPQVDVRKMAISTTKCLEVLQHRQAMAVMAEQQRKIDIKMLQDVTKMIRTGLGINETLFTLEQIIDLEEYRGEGKG